MASEPVIEISNANVFLDREQIIHELNWRVDRGKHCFILGANGAGKTTLVKMLMGFVWPVFGAEVKVLGNRYGASNLTEVRKKIAWVSPYLQSWASSRWKAVEMVLSGLDSTIGLFRAVSNEETEKALEVMKLLHCEHVADHSFDKLSSGEQIKMLIGRALISEPELLILDEPCVHLDMKSREFLLETIEKLASGNQNLTILFITQRIEDISPVFKQGTIMKSGRIIHQGDRNDILTEENLSEAFDMHIKLHKSSDGRLWPLPE